MPSSHRILIADDQPQLCASLAFLLEHLPNVQVLTAGDGPSTVQLALAHKPDLVLLDVMMPGLDGYSACRQIRQAWKDHSGQIWFMTVRDSRFDQNRARMAGAQACIIKPFAPEMILENIRAALGIKQNNQSSFQTTSSTD